MNAGACMLPERPPDGHRGGGTGGAISTVEKRGTRCQGGEEASAASTKHPGRMAGLLSSCHWYLCTNTPKCLMCSKCK